MLKEFYGVTSACSSKSTSVSVYRITVGDNAAFSEENTDPDPNRVIMRKIGLIGESSIKTGDYLGSGPESYQRTVGVSKDFGFQRYERTGHRRVDQVNTVSWGAGTTPIVALFTDEEAAHDCSRQEGLSHWDERFLQSSIDVVKQIGTDPNTPVNLDESLCRALEQNRLEELLQSS